MDVTENRFYRKASTQPSADEVECVAQALWEKVPSFGDVSWKEANEVLDGPEWRRVVADYRNMARAAIAALRPTDSGLIARFEEYVKAIPLGHAIPTIGDSSYNWGMRHLSVLKSIASQTTAEGVGHD